MSAGPQLLRLDSVGSTMDLLHELAADGAAAGTVVIAGEQTAGRGSRGRSWKSAAGGLWLSALYRPHESAGVELFSLRAGLAVAEAIEAVLPGLRLAIKWPNDLMLDDRKLGGILCEARWQGEALAWVVVGVGVNAANPIPVELRDVAVRLGDLVPGFSPEALEPPVAERLRSLAPGRARLDEEELRALRQRDWLFARRLQGPVPGVAAGIAADGALLVRDGAGVLQEVRAGTVELAQPTLTP
jgi:BirA family transcriptional regulator, biotin operon repressor / biotin---[acetyl-CoA-carboxylase] ligase